MATDVTFGSGGPLPVELVSTRTLDGVLIQGALAGPGGAARAILSAHGAWGNFYSSPPSELLRAGPARGLRVLALNSRFHDLATLGDGEPCVGFINHRFSDSVNDLAAAADLLSSLGVERFVLVAHSYGTHQAALWLSREAHPAVAGAVLASPGPPLQLASRGFVDGCVEQHLAAAARAVAEGDPRRLVSLGNRGPVAMVAEAATVLETWDRGALTDARLHLPKTEVPVLVISGRREPKVYADYAQEVAVSAPHGDLLLLDDDHYYSRDRPGFARAVLDWARSGQLL